MEITESKIKQEIKQETNYRDDQNFNKEINTNRLNQDFVIIVKKESDLDMKDISIETEKNQTNSILKKELLEISKMKNNPVYKFCSIDGKMKAFCTICKKLFMTLHTLKTHISSVHDRKKPFECEVCHVGFAEKRNMQRHFDAKHEKKRPFSCTFCSYKASQKV